MLINSTDFDPVAESIVVSAVDGIMSTLFDRYNEAIETVKALATDLELVRLGVQPLQPVTATRVKDAQVSLERIGKYIALTE
jgi:hypothetical protein